MSARVMTPRPSRLSNSVALAGLLAAAGCSALVSPDPGRLGGGGIDAGPAETDTGPRPDVGPLDAWAADAWRPDLPDAGTDAGPVCPPSCADEHDCTTDRCVAGSCVHEPDDALCPGGRCSPELGCVPTVCSSNEECQDGDRCNGAERCDPSAGTDDGCVPAAAPLDCNDGVSCTDDHCAADRGCFHDRFDDRCEDGIACTDDVCTGTAGPTGCEFRTNDMLCNAGCTMGARCTPAGCMGGAPRVCMDDGNACTVERCDVAGGACVADPLDADMDGYPAMTATNGGTTTRCAGGTDCDDSRAAVNPRATETCGNGLDDDCNPATSDTCAGTPGDTCATALPITLTGGVGTVTFMPSTLRNDYSTSCGGMGNDAVYYFDVTGVSDVRIETTGAVDTVLATSTTCDVAAFRDRCNDDRDPGSVTTSRIWLRRVGAVGSSTRVYVLVDDYAGGDTDAATLSIAVSTPTPDVCPPSGSSVRPLDVSGGGVVFGRIAPATGPVPSGMRGSCQSPTSMTPEAMFRIDEADRNLTRLETATTGFVPDLYVRHGGCAGGSEIRCVNGTAGGGGGTAVLEGVTSGSTSTLFYAFVDNAPAAGGEYRFTFDP